MILSKEERKDWNLKDHKIKNKLKKMKVYIIFVLKQDMEKKDYN